MLYLYIVIFFCFYLVAQNKYTNDVRAQINKRIEKKKQMNTARRRMKIKSSYQHDFEHGTIMSINSTDGGE